MRKLPLVLVWVLLPGCGSDLFGLGMNDGDAPPMARGGGETPPPVDPGSDEDFSGDTGSSSNSGNGSGEVEAGVLTAADWDDNLNFDLYDTYLAEFGENNPNPGLPALPHDRVVIMVTDSDGLGVGDAVVEITAADGTTEMRTGSDGRAYYFPDLDGSADTFTVTATALDANTTATMVDDGVPWIVQLDTQRQLATALDLALVIDTTGSMGDEIRYLQTELDWVVDTVGQNHPNLDLRVALVAYRDESDDYQVLSHEFTSDIDAFLGNLSQLSAAGGGDYPESVAEGLDAAMDLAWRDSATVRVAFLVGDAPPKTERQVNTTDGGMRARELGVRIYPVAASGVADLAEWVFRQLAQFTGGRYLFLTNDSGVGNEHAEPHIPCYLVQKLNILMLRMIESELVGARLYPTEDEIIRAAGDPEAGQCIIEEQTYYY